MRSEFDETQLTAYVLGELDPQERSAVASLIASSPEARREVEAIQAATVQLRSALAAAEPGQELSRMQRAAVEAEAARELLPMPQPRRRWFLGAAFATAAAATLVALVAPSLFRARLKPAGVTTLADHHPSSVSPSLAPGPTVPMSQSLARETRAQLKSLGYLPSDSMDQDTVPTTPVSEPSTGFNTEAYDHILDNPFVLVAQDPRSTFSADVDTASYSIVRRFLSSGQLPPKDAVRIEELLNYFPYSYEPPRDARPFAVHMDAAVCPWNADHKLVRIALKGRALPPGERPPANLVFLIDVSGSMNVPNKLPLAKAALRLLVDGLNPQDRIAIVVYAGAEGLALPSTPATDKTAILSAIESLSPGGSTHASAGIRLAYQTAAAHFIKGGVNRVILATDGDFNVGVTSQGGLVRLIEDMAKRNVFLTALGFGMGNLKDATLQKLANHGNGNYAYIDGLAEARKVLVEQSGGTLVTIAKDVKLQVEFNPRKVKAFRLIGYEKRVLAHQDFNDDKRDAGEIGAGHTVTALYEVVPHGVEVTIPGVDPLKYQQAPRPNRNANGNELLTLKLRYKEPEGERSSHIETALDDSNQAFVDASPDFRFAAAVAAFGMTLRDSPYKGNADLGQVLNWSKSAVGEDEGGLRAQFIAMVEKARTLSSNR